MEEKKFLDEVLGHIPRATWREKREIRAELAGHLADHALDLEERGCAAEEAREQAVAAMGDPGEIGEALNAQLSTFWLNVQVVVQGAIAILLILILWQVDWLEPFRLIQQNRMARRGELPLWSGYCYTDPHQLWRCGDEMVVGDSVLRLVAVSENPYISTDEVYLCEFELCTYREQVWKPAWGAITQHIQLIPQGGEVVRPGSWWPISDCGYALIDCQRVQVPADAEYVDVVYDYLGVHQEMRCYIRWEEHIWIEGES